MRIVSLAALLTGAPAIIFSVEAADYSVSNPVALEAALGNAVSGDRIFLAPGKYGALEIRGRRFAPAVALAAADPLSPPEFVSITLEDVGGLSISGIRVAYGPTQAPLSSYAINVLRSSDIGVDRAEIASAEDGVAGNDAYGVNIRDSARVRLAGNRIHDVYRGVAALDSDDVVITRNVIQRVGSDGIVGRGAAGLSVRDNYFSNFAIINLEEQHPDAIQLWSRGAARANENVIIAGNIIRREGGDRSQGIFVKTPELATRNLLIEDNIVEQSMAQGIFVENGEGVIVRRNTVVPHDFRYDKPGIEIRGASANAVVSDNIAMAYRLAAGVADNANVTADYYNPWISAFIGAHIASPAAPATPADYAPLGSAGAQSYVKDVWAGTSDPHPGALTPPAIIADLAISSGGAVDSAPQPAPLAAVADTSGATFYISGPSATLSAAMNLTIAARAALPSVAAGWRLLAAVPSSYDMRVDRDNIRFSIWTAAGVSRLDGKSTAILDLATHDIDGVYDGVSGFMAISVDGVEIARRSASVGPVAYNPTQSLYVGGAPWGLLWSDGIKRVKITR